MDFIDGKIIEQDDFDKSCSFVIEQITAEFEEDMPNVEGIVRCTGITIESDAPSDINSDAETELYNEFADVEYNNADGDGNYVEQARKDISERTGVDVSRIDIQ